VPLEAPNRFRRPRRNEGAAVLGEAVLGRENRPLVKFAPRINSGSIVLPKHERMVAQICGLERRTGRSGKDSIDHAPHAHDDLANCVAGAATTTKHGRYGSYVLDGSWIDHERPSDELFLMMQARGHRGRTYY
jgi:hypothetical protein